MPFGDTPGLDAGFGRPDFMMPQGALITSALSNKGNPTGFGQDNTFRVLDQQEIRLVDNKGNLLFSGVGPEAAKKAVEIGQGISNEKGNKADWTIQTGTQYTNFDGTVGTRWDDVAHEKKNKSALSVVGDVLGTALPIAVGFIPGLQGVGAVLASAGAGGAGAALRGDNILKGAIMGGLGAAGGQYLSTPIKGLGVGADAARAIGTGVGTTAGGLATGQSLKNSLLGGVTSGGLSYLGGEIFGDRGGPSGGGEGNTGGIGSSGVELGDINVTARIPNFSGTAFNTNFFDRAQMGDQAPDRSIAEGGIGGSGVELNPSDIVVTGRGGIPNFSGTAFTPTFFDNASDFAVNPNTQPSTTGDTTSDEIIVNAKNPIDILPPGFDLAAANTANAEGATTSQDTDRIGMTPEEIAALSAGAGGAGILSKLAALSTADKLRLASIAAGTIGGLIGGGGGSTGGGGGTIPAGLGQLRSPLFNQQLTPLTPEQNRAKYGARDMSGIDWKTWGSRPATSFFNYVPQPTGMAHGGSFAAKRGGMKPRTQFAVSGPGTGRSDDIPAVLSDGEYVIDAETVALLGDGSSKAGAKKLDDLRVKVRKHKGKKLAQGRFSANAKSPEAYLSGGRA